jgi:hypothetical protein
MDLKVSNMCTCRLNREESDRFAQFETKFKKFLYGGVTVQHLKPNSTPTRDGMTRREKRTLWLMLPEVGSLRLGLVSTVKDNGIDTTMDDVTVASSAASSRADADVSIYSISFDDTLQPDFRSQISAVVLIHSHAPRIQFRFLALRMLDYP